MSFKDHFSGHAGDYSKHRPHYPSGLFTYLNTIANNHGSVWDCATGSGQAAIGLSSYFDKIYASDASEEQIKNASLGQNIEYFVASAEQSTLENNSIDLITVAQAAHWFNHDLFYLEVNRIAKPDAMIALWSYGNVFVNEKIDSIIEEYYNDITGPYWPPERHFIDDKYETIPFPYTKMKTPDFSINYQWTWEQMKNYLMTWSATQRYMKDQGQNPLNLIEDRMKESWPGMLKIEWPIYLLLGRVSIANTLK